MIDEKRIEELTYYWSKTAKNDRLYIAIRANDTAGIERLRAEGAVLSDHIKGMFKNGGGSLVNPNEYGMDWYDFSYGLGNYSPEEFISVIRNLYAELGEPIYYSDTVGSNISEFYRADVFKCVLECFDNKKISKNRTLRGIIDRGNTELLGFTAERGWLRLAKQLDELIEYSQQKGKTECTAFLLEFKNRAFDAAKEREKAEKKQTRELNAAPDSVTALKQLWKYKKREGENCDGLAITGYKGTQTEIVIPEKIGKSAVTAIKPDTYPSGTPKNYFAPHEIQISITKITLPQGLVTIGDGSFCEFKWLHEINIPDGVTSIGKLAFFGCTMLRQLRLPDSVTEIGSYAFQECTNLEEINIPRGVTEICELAFAWCESLQAIEIPETVKSIENNAFGGCKSLKAVIIPNGVTVINRGAFGSCEKLTRVELPDTVVKIDTYAFFGCKSLKEFVIPEGVCEIGESAFGDCSALKELVIPEGVLEIGELAFSDCRALEKVVLPASLKKAKNRTLRDEIKISRTIFDNSPNVTAVVTPKSYAEKYCKRNNIPFVYKEN